MSWIFRAALVATSLAVLSSCGSSALKNRREQRDKGMASAKLYCEFVNGEEFPDIDVQMNLQMASKCDSDKSYSISSYKTPSEISGMMFCCTVHPKAIASSASATNKSDAAAKVEKAAKSDKKSDGLDE